MTTTLPTVLEVAKTIDHALLKPDLTKEGLYAGLELAKKHNIFSVCVKPGDVSAAVEFLKDTDVKVGTVIGFPHGTQHWKTKIFEIEQAAEDGAHEVDVVINYGNLKDVASGVSPENAFSAELRAFVKATRANKLEVIKVILETAALTPEEIFLGSELVHEAGADFVKTSTGFSTAGATVPNLKIMKSAISAPTQLKASGGVTSLDILLEMRELGVTRFGSSATEVILTELAARLEGNTSDSTYTESY